MKRFRILPGESLLILGGGPMGMLLLQALKHNGAAQVVVVEKQPARMELARSLGAAAVVPVGPDQDAHLKEIAPRGFGVVVDATGIPAVIEHAFTYLRPRGQYLQFGVAPNHAKVQVSPYDIFRNDWTIIGSFALCYTFLPAIALLNNGIVKVESLVSDTTPLANFSDVFHRFAAGQTMKVHVTAN
jgi:threonine dehydrogenase-like Zn-dependent dehydrogenase